MMRPKTISFGMLKTNLQIPLITSRLVKLSVNSAQKAL